MLGESEVSSVPGHEADLGGEIFHGLYLGREKQSEALRHSKLHTKSNEYFITLKLTF